MQNFVGFAHCSAYDIVPKERGIDKCLFLRRS